MNEVAAAVRRTGAAARALDAAWLGLAIAYVALAAVVPQQAIASALFVGGAVLEIAPYFALAVGLAAYAKASGADSLIARAFRGRPVRMILVAALFGALSPFCSCGVIPVIASLLAMGVPLSAVMAFWLSSPIIDPSMFMLTAGVLGLEFAVAKTIAAAGLGLLGGYATLVATRRGVFAAPLRSGVAACGDAGTCTPGSVAWRVWRERARLRRLAGEAGSVTLFLGKWLLIAFTLESLMVAYVPAETIAALLGADSAWAMGAAVVVGVPAYLNGYAALGLVGGLVEGGMAPGAGLAFLVAGGVTSIPAAIAVFALARLSVFLWYVALAIAGAFVAGFGYQAVLAL